MAPWIKDLQYVCHPTSEFWELKIVLTGFRFQSKHGVHHVTFQCEGSHDNSDLALVLIASDEVATMLTESMKQIRKSLNQSLKVTKVPFTLNQLP